MALPFDVIQNVVSFLPYAERVDMNRILPIEHRIIKRIDSDSHNIYVKINLMTNKLARFNSAQSKSKERIRIMKEFLLYILHTKDMCILRNTTVEFRNTLREKAMLFLSDAPYDLNMVLLYRREIRSLQRVCEKLISKMDIISLTTPIKLKFVTVV